MLFPDDSQFDGVFCQDSEEGGSTSTWNSCSTVGLHEALEDAPLRNSLERLGSVQSFERSLLDEPFAVSQTDHSLNSTNILPLATKDGPNDNYLTRTDHICLEAGFNPGRDFDSYNAGNRLSGKDNGSSNLVRTSTRHTIPHSEYIFSWPAIHQDNNNTLVNPPPTPTNLNERHQTRTPTAPTHHLNPSAPHLITLRPSRRTQRYYCPDPACGHRSFGRRSDRDRHVRKHSVTKRTFVCLELGCGKRFYRKDKLLDHSRQGHRSNAGVCTCNFGRL
ncbi:hypothetical protein K432DRAFT_1580 [Lepidopterella palustris CBS 459.81]|uniref:C2H2-type domain-containing protein n=1 Tax=Lepidopterella palustris CBS 459.81 TaxID=1314670 RepID=A0A8E2JL52_9PEZI|nr:hypothetical protein K432DRAFT_1580 [Lepidopterella palustris CBS 459.81]